MSGKGAALRRHNKVMDRRRKAKAAKRALYESYRDSNKNSKRAKTKKIVGGCGHPHLTACGNIGCLRCSESARAGYINLAVAIRGTDAAIDSAKKRGWSTAVT